MNNDYEITVKRDGVEIVVTRSFSAGTIEDAADKIRNELHLI